MKHTESPDHLPHPENQKDTVQITAELDTCKKDLNESEENYRRLSADFQNFKKRLEKDRESWNYVIKSSVIKPFLLVIDHFDQAFRQLSAEQKEDESWVEGFKLIYKELEKALEQTGVTEIPTKFFNPEFHEAIAQVSNPDYQSGSIVEVFQKGYMIDGKVVRPATVSIAQ